MKEKMEDRRIMRTRNMLYDAFLDLMIEKGYESITVQDIIDRANIGRSTFYLHFTDKENLLLSNMEQLRHFLKDQSLNNPILNKEEYQFGFSFAMLQHAQGHKRLYKAIVGKKGGTAVIYHMKNMVCGLISDDIEALLPFSSLPIPKEAVIDFVVNTFMTLISWWMDNNMPCPAEEVNRIFHKLALNGLNSLKASV
ncbi:MAG: TetR/AcrR family transcriptional regulator [Bacillota bacterium]|nr:TetR/AcrR family transcriptional regulator [Bacillota bacterium]